MKKEIKEVTLGLFALSAILSPKTIDAAEVLTIADRQEFKGQEMGPTVYHEQLSLKYIMENMPSDIETDGHDDILKELAKVASYIPQKWVGGAFLLMKDPADYPIESTWVFEDVLITKPKGHVYELLKNKDRTEGKNINSLRSQILPNCSLEERANGVVAIIHHICEGFEYHDFVANPLLRNIISLPASVMLETKSLYRNPFHSFHPSISTVLKTKTDLLDFMAKLTLEDSLKVQENIEKIEFEEDGTFKLFDDSSRPTKNYDHYKKIENICVEKYCSYIPQDPLYKSMSLLTPQQMRAFVAGIQKGTQTPYYNQYDGQAASLLKHCLGMEPKTITEIWNLPPIPNELRVISAFSRVAKNPKADHAQVIAQLRTLYS